ncbi:MAG: PIN domain-containing protein [Limisphaerales bacterium]
MIFVDTGAFVGRFLVNDQYHETALQLWDTVERTNEACLTSNLVLVEFITLLARRSTPSYAAEKARLIYGSARFEILRPGPVEEAEALTVLLKYADQRVSFTDCVSFVLMQRQNLRTAFTFDTHFRLAGFELWS